ASRRSGWATATDVCAATAFVQLHGPGSHAAPDGGLRRAVDAEGGSPFDTRDRTAPMPRETPVMRAVPCERELLMLFSLCERLALPSSAIPTFGRHNCVSVTSAGRT